MRITIAKKLWLSFIILILILGVSGAIFYLQIEKLNSTLTRFLSAQEPLENALLEMEVSIGETAISVLAFVRDGNQVHIENQRRFQKKFETFLTRFNTLAATKPEGLYGREAVKFFKEHLALSNEIIVLVKNRKRTQKTFTELVEELNVIIDENISTTADENAGTLSTQKAAAMLLKISFHRMFSAIESYEIQQKPNLKTEISKAEEAYLKWKSIYARTGLSPSAEASLHEINRKSETTFASGAEIIHITDQLQLKIEEFEKGLLKVRRTLNEKIRPLIRQETETMAKAAIHHGEVALSVTIGMTLFVLVAMGVATWLTTRGIIRSVRQLKEGSDAFGRGNLDHRIEPEANDELKDVAEAFNQMAEKRKTAEQQVQESADKIKLFSYSISHDLKSPAIGIHGLAMLLQKQSEDSLDEKGTRTCNQIVKTSALIEELVNHINTFISTREAPLTLEKIPMYEVLDVIRDEVWERLEAAGVKWSQPDHLPEIRADRLSMIRVIRNLVDNALKYGGEKLSRIVFDHTENETHHIFSVADDGAGLQKEELEGIFDAFKRKKSARGIQGTGLGLAIVKEIMARHGGEAWAEPGVEQGVTFYLSISKTL
ncbi:MAG: HAMP domain-containing protein [Deltaproteobacteria bacterium]|nr:HAMP domain-containing protein [Deltaproteobacteria bacterium]